MTDIFNTRMMMNNHSTSLVHLGGVAGTDYLQVFKRKRKTKWDEVTKPCKLNYLTKDFRNSRRTRWGPIYEKTFTPTTVSKIPEEVDIDTFEILLRRNRLEDVTRRLQCGDWEDVDPDLRSPSPEPIYDPKSGFRLNTREVRNREKYAQERNSIIEELMKMDKSYRAPSDYKPPKKTKKIIINEYDNEKHKLVALILGPHGVTQKELEKKSGCRISVRGKGSNWTNNSMDRTYHDENEPLHVYLVADKEEQIRKGTALIEPILDPFSEEHYKHKSMQKNAIAIMYGYQTETACENCGDRHRTWACPLNFGNFTKADVKCAICGEKSHPTLDCPEKKNLDEKNEAESDLAKFFKDIDELKKNAETLVLESEKKVDDIRDSVIFTGKIPEPLNKINQATTLYSTETIKTNFSKPLESSLSLENINRSLDSESTVNVNQTIIPNIIQNNTGMVQNISSNNVYNIPSNLHTPVPPFNMMSDNKLRQIIATDYRLPMIPITDNPNIIRAPAVNYMAPQMNNAMMSSFNSYYSNPFGYSQGQMPNAGQMPYSGINYMTSGYQGKVHFNPNVNSFLMKIPSNYQRPPLIGMNMNSSIPNVNFRMNMSQSMMQPHNLPPQNFFANQVRISSDNISQPPEPQEPEPLKNDDIQIDEV
jgi:hypothetical protein